MRPNRVAKLLLTDFSPQNVKVFWRCYEYEEPVFLVEFFKCCSPRSTAPDEDSVTAARFFTRGQVEDFSEACNKFLEMTKPIEKEEEY